jgi:hypothetical protein
MGRCCGGDLSVTIDGETRSIGAAESQARGTKETPTGNDDDCTASGGATVWDQ